LPLSAELAPGDRFSVDYLVSQFTALYLRQERRRPEQAEGILAREVLPVWGGRDARSITAREVIDLLNGMVARGAPTQANWTAALLSLMFRFAIQQQIVENNPAQLTMPPGGHETPRRRVLSEDELRRFLHEPEECVHLPWLARVVTLLLTGARKGELAKAPWREIDFGKRIWTIPYGNAKNELEHLVPLSEWAVDELRWLKNRAGGALWVMPSNVEGKHVIGNVLSDALRETLSRFKMRGIAPFRLHDLRRPCAPTSHGSGLSRTSRSGCLATSNRAHTITGLT
jgi:integrase